MRVIVEIPDEEYECYALAITFGMGSKAIKRILDGTPLPKGHGRLIDENVLVEKAVSVDTDEECYLCVMVDDIADVPTIIEADTEGAE